jgi:endonuclease-3 related protein
LRQHDLIDPDSLQRCDAALLSELIRPAGFGNAKTAYLQAMAAFVVDGGGLAELGNLPTRQLRAALLSVRGIGPETADSILLYLFERPVWIRDAYAARLLARLSGIPVEHVVQDDWVAEWVSGERTADLSELHALIVQHGKSHCRAVPTCHDCPLLSLCAHGTRTIADNR